MNNGPVYVACMPVGAINVHKYNIIFTPWTAVEVLHFPYFSEELDFKMS